MKKEIMPCTTYTYYINTTFVNGKKFFSVKFFCLEMSDKRTWFTKFCGLHSLSDINRSVFTDCSALL